MRHCLLLLLSLFVYTVLSAQIQVAFSLENNVVAITASNADGVKSYGFGFVTGERNNQLFVATAAHLVVGAANIKLKFKDEMSFVVAELLKADDKIDVAVLRVKSPPGYKWKKDCVSSPDKSEAVTFIGRDQAWFIPTKNVEGVISQIRGERIFVEIVSVRPGTSGAPLIDDKGIVGIITVAEANSSAEAISIKRVEEFITDYGNCCSYAFRESKKVQLPPPVRRKVRVQLRGGPNIGPKEVTIYAGDYYQIFYKEAPDSYNQNPWDYRVFVADDGRVRVSAISPETKEWKHGNKVYQKKDGPSTLTIAKLTVSAFIIE